MEMPNRSPVMLKNRFYSFIRKNENYAKLLGETKDCDRKSFDAPEDEDTGADSDFDEETEENISVKHSESIKTVVSSDKVNSDFNIDLYQGLFKNLKEQIRNPITKPSKQNLLALTDSLGTLLIDVS